MSKRNKSNVAIGYVYVPEVWYNAETELIAVTAGYQNSLLEVQDIDGKIYQFPFSILVRLGTWIYIGDVADPKDTDNIRGPGPRYVYP